MENYIMSDNSNKPVVLIIFLIISFMAIGYLGYNSYILNTKLELCNEELELYSEQLKSYNDVLNNCIDYMKSVNERVDYYAEISNDFHSNLYAQTIGSAGSGAHTLSISDVYYRKNFTSNENK